MAFIEKIRDTLCCLGSNQYFPTKSQIRHNATSSHSKRHQGQYSSQTPHSGARRRYKKSRSRDSNRSKRNPNKIRQNKRSNELFENYSYIEEEEELDTNNDHRYLYGDFDHENERNLRHKETRRPSMNGSTTVVAERFVSKSNQPYQFDIPGEISIPLDEDVPSTHGIRESRPGDYLSDEESDINRSYSKGQYLNGRRHHNDTADDKNYAKIVRESKASTRDRRMFHNWFKGGESVNQRFGVAKKNTSGTKVKQKHRNMTKGIKKQDKINHTKKERFQEQERHNYGSDFMQSIQHLNTMRDVSPMSNDYSPLLYRSKHRDSLRNKWEVRFERQPSEDYALARTYIKGKSRYYNNQQGNYNDHRYDPMNGLDMPYTSNTYDSEDFSDKGTYDRAHLPSRWLREGSNQEGKPPIEPLRWNMSSNRKNIQPKRRKTQVRAVNFKR